MTSLLQLLVSILNKGILRDPEKDRVERRMRVTLDGERRARRIGYFLKDQSDSATIVRHRESEGVY